MDEQLRLIDLIPKRLSVFALLLLGGVTAIVGLEALYAWMPELAAKTHDGRVAALDLDSEGSLGAWFSSLLLLAASVTSLLVYTVRSHRTDDYQGRYRVWLWAAFCWFLMAADEACSLHEGFKEMMTLASGTRLMGDGSVWWAGAYTLLLGVVGTRLLLDMRHSWLAAIAFLLAGVSYVLAVLAQFDWALPEGGAKAVMLEEGAEMVGNLLLLTAMGLYGRFVVLDAEGLLPRRQRKAAKERRTKLAAAKARPTESRLAEAPPQSQDQPTPVGVDPPHATPQPAMQRRAAVSAPAKVPASGDETSEEAMGNQPMSKADRKALRKRLEQQRLQREQQQRNKWK